MSDFIKAIVIPAIIIVFIAFGIYFIKQEMCFQKAVGFEESRFGLFSGCMVKHNGRWLPLENIRGFDDE